MDSLQRYGPAATLMTGFSRQMQWGEFDPRAVPQLQEQSPPLSLRQMRGAHTNQSL